MSIVNTNTERRISEDGISHHSERRNPIMQYFKYEHLPEKLQEVSKPLGELALILSGSIPNGPEKSEGLRKLLEAKDCFVRASL